MASLKEWAFLLDYRYHAMKFKMTTKSLRREGGIGDVLKCMCSLSGIINPSHVNNPTSIINIGSREL
jgi:hypothetical protein